MYKLSNWVRHQKAVVFAVVITPIAIVLACKTSVNVSKVKSELGETGSVTRIIDQGLGQYRIVLKDDNEALKNNPTATIKWHVVSGWSREAVDCSKISKANERAQLTVAALEVSTIIQINPTEFSNCGPDAAAAAQGRKVSLECQQSGNWDGSRLIELCVFDASNNVIASGRGTPVKPSPAAMATEIARAVTEIASDAAVFKPKAHTDDVLNYGQVCAERLGPLPTDWSCLDGQILPITKDGVETPFGQHKLDDKCDKTIYLGLGDQGQCVPYSRLLRLYTKKDVETVVICRRYKIGEEGPNSTVINHIGPDVPLAQDVAIVQHNIKTGETCFFQALSGFMPGRRDLPVARIPPPNETKIPDAIVEKYKHLPEDQRPVAAADFWIKPSDPGTDPTGGGFQCITCHDSDPFMHSPYVDQLNFDFKFTPVAAELFGTPRSRDNLVNPGVGKHPFEGRMDKLVPCAPGPKGAVKDGGVPDSLCVYNKGEGVNEAKGKYSLVHQVHQRSFPNTWSVIPKSPSGGLDETCVKCHRIGSINTCSSWVPDSIGKGGIASNEQRTKYGAGFPFSHWMPVTDPTEFMATNNPKCVPDANDPEKSKTCEAATLKAWKQQFEAGANLLNNCCQLAAGLQNKDPNLNPAFAASCQAFPVSSPPPGTGGVTGSFVLQATASPIGAAGKETLVLPLTGALKDGKISHVLANLHLTHKSPGDITIALQHNGRTVEIFNGDKDLQRPNRAITDFKLSIDSADYEDTFKPLINDAANSAWSLVITDDGAVHGGSIDKVTVQVGVN